MNDALKVLFKMAGLDKPTTKTYFIGNERRDVTLPLYERISTHVGRKTFVVTGLSSGLSPCTITQWTGHSSLKAMKPYMALADKVKKESMKKKEEWASLRSQIATINGRGQHRKYLPYAFTEHGVIMAAAILKSEIADKASVKVVEAIDQIPTPSQLQKKYEDRLNGSVPQKPAPEPKKERKPKAPDFFKTYDMFLKECGDKNAWTEATFEKMEAMRVDQEDLVGLKNSTIEKKLGYLRWFLNWATDRGYNTNLDYKKFRPTLKMTQRKVIYLTKEEIARVRDLELSEAQAYLDPIRDIFLFCCFSGRRTFIVNALSMGITPNIVMKWTGHSDYKAMKPYIDIVDSIKASSMTKFDGLI